ncbi:hypothetical protein ACHAPT_007992 [Fusarium lateritium]
MSPKSRSGGSSVYSDDRFSSTSSQYSVTYTRLPKKQPLSIRFLSWAAGAPSGATAVKRKTRDIRDDRSTRSGGSSGSYFSEPDTQLFWVASPHSGNYYGSGGSSSGRSSRSGRSRKSGGSGSRKHFDGAVPRPQPPPPVPANGHFVPPQPPMNPPPAMGPMGGEFGGGFMPPPPPPMNMPHPPPPPMNMPHPPPPMPGAAPFIDLTGQNQAGMSYSSADSGSYCSDWSDNED